MKILVAAYDDGHASELLARFKAMDDGFAVTLAGPGDNLLAAVRETGPDVVIVDMARPDRDGLDGVRALNALATLPVLMFIDEDDPVFMEEAIAAGVCSYHVGGVAAPAIRPILRAAMAVFQRMRGLERQLAAAREQIEARRIVDAAKRLLMARDKMSEPAAHRFLQRRAMDRQVKITEIAAALVRDRATESKND